MVKIPRQFLDVAHRLTKPFRWNRDTLDYTPYSYLSEGTEADVGEPLTAALYPGSAVAVTTSFPSLQPFFQRHPDVPLSALKITRWTVTIRSVTNPPNATIGVIDNTDGFWINTPARQSIGRFSVNPPRPPNGEFLLGFNYTQPIAAPTGWVGMNFTFVNAAPGDELSWNSAGFGQGTFSIIKGSVSLSW